MNYNYDKKVPKNPFNYLKVNKFLIAKFHLYHFLYRIITLKDFLKFSLKVEYKTKAIKV